eukprot:scaffold24261_cov51-Phaeocystis_antarctica.AAC.1
MTNSGLEPQPDEGSGDTTVVHPEQRAARTVVILAVLGWPFPPLRRLQHGPCVETCNLAPSAATGRPVEKAFSLRSHTFTHLWHVGEPATQLTCAATQPEPPP